MENTNKKGRGRPRKHYQDREGLKRMLIECQESKQVSDELILAFIQIMDGYAASLKSIDPWQDEKKSYAIEHFLKYYHNIDPEKNIFAYITQLCKNAFRHFYIRYQKKHTKLIYLEKLQKIDLYI